MPMAKLDFTAIILAAGRGVRMRSALPKVLHPVAGDPMISRSIQQVRKAGAKEIRIVVGYGEELVRQVVEPQEAVCFRQTDPKGTADAVRAAKPEGIQGPVMILNGDHPLITAADLEEVVSAYKDDSKAIWVVSSEVKRPGHYGRVVRHQGQVKAIVEAKDASAETLKIQEVNTGMYMLEANLLKELLPKIENNNAQGEFYLTDLISLAQDQGISVQAKMLGPRAAAGVNSQQELARATRYVFMEKAKSLMDDGVMIMDPKNTYIEENVEVGASTVIYPGVYLKGDTKIGEFCVLEPNCFIHNAKIAESVQVRAGSYLEDCKVGAKTILGPYARIRPDTEIGKDARIGNFVELKKVKFGDGAKANHLTYLGDAEIGAGSNIGCGTITCNYAVDKKKYRTIIGKDVFVGSDSQFVAPITVGDNAVIGSGTTVTKDVPEGALAVGRAKQIIKENYKAKK